MTQDQVQRIASAALELATALNDAGAEFDVRVDTTVVSRVGGVPANVYSVEVLHLRPLVLVHA